MKKAYTRGEKWLFASPLLFLVVPVVTWVRQQNQPQPKAKVKQQTQTKGIALPRKGIQSFSFSPDSRRLVVFNDNQSGVGAYGYLYDVKTRRKIRDLVPQTSGLKGWQALLEDDPAWSPDGKEIVVFATPPRPRGPFTASKVVVWNAATGTIKKIHTYTKREDSPIYGRLRYSSDGKTLIGSGIPPTVFDVATGKRLNKPDKSANQLGETRELNEKLGLIAVRSSVDKEGIRVVDARTKKLVWQPETQLGSVNFYGWYGDVLSVNGSLNKWKPQRVNDDSFNNPQRRILWDGKTRQLLSALPWEAGETLGWEAFSPDNRTSFHSIQKLYRNGNDLDEKRFFVRWDYRAGRELWRVETPYVLGFPEWSPDGKWLMWLGEENRNSYLYVFDSKGKQRLKHSHSPFNYLTCWSPDSKKLASFAYRKNSLGKIGSLTIEIFDFKD